MLVGNGVQWQQVAALLCCTSCLPMQDIADLRTINCHLEHVPLTSAVLGLLMSAVVAPVQTPGAFMACTVQGPDAMPAQQQLAAPATSIQQLLCHLVPVMVETCMHRVIRCSNSPQTSWQHHQQMVA